MGGFTKKILESNDCNVISIDRDPDVKKYSSELKKFIKIGLSLFWVNLVL